MDDCTIAGIIGRRGSGKTTLLKTLAAREKRVLCWDWRGEYAGHIVQLADLPQVFRRQSFRAVYRPGNGDTMREFDALAHVVRKLGHRLTLTVDEVSLVVPNYREGGLGLLLRFSRPQGINILWATQRPTHIPGVLLSESNALYVFHLHHPADLRALSTVCDDGDLDSVRTLPPHKYLTVQP